MKISDFVPDTFKANQAYMNIIKRVSIRRYLDKHVTDEQATALLHAAMSAPTAVNRQPWEFVVVDDPALLKALADALPYAKMAADASLAIVCCGNKERFLDGDDSSLWEQDLSAASENILLAAHALGLGGVWTCLYPHPDRMAAAAAILGLSDNFVPFNLIPIGYPDKDRRPMEKWHPDRVHINKM